MSIQQGQTLDELRQIAHQLIDEVSRRPGGAKLLLGVLTQLELFANYKANCSKDKRLKS